MEELLFAAVVIYLIYKIVFGLLIPVVQATLKMKHQFRNMKSADGQGPANPPNDPGNSKAKSKPKEVIGDYIDFEEIKK